MYLVPKSIEDLNRQLSTSVGFDSFFNRLFDGVVICMISYSGAFGDVDDYFLQLFGNTDCRGLAAFVMRTPALT